MLASGLVGGALRLLLVGDGAAFNVSAPPLLHIYDPSVGSFLCSMNQYHLLIGSLLSPASLLWVWRTWAYVLTLKGAIMYTVLFVPKKVGSSCWVGGSAASAPTHARP
uniref:Uncharacterized protein n=1 Tax=Knipowitschia caucasica TaxID=637954 RepID=A0AAV2KEU6_KNICA